MAGGQTLWSWRAGANLAALSALHDGLSLSEAPGHARVALHGGQSWLLLDTAQLPLPAGATLEIELGWPWPADNSW